MKKIVILVAILLLASSAQAEFAVDEISNLSTFYFSPAGLDKLNNIGFFVTSSGYDEMYELYDDCRENNQPIFVTTDSVLHTSHIFFDYILRILEIEELYGAAEELTNRMITMSELQYEEAEDIEVKEAARLNIGFFSVAKKIFSPTYEAGFELKDIVNKEYENIEKHEGIKFRELLTYVEDPTPQTSPYAFEDYSQYVPRGHYTRNEMFEKYFKVMMWYGRMDFKLKPGDGEAAVSDGRKMTLQSLLIIDAMMKDEDAHWLWSKIYGTTTYFVGESDDLNADDYGELVEEVFPLDGSVDNYGENMNLTIFIGRAVNLEGPAILSNFAFRDQGDPTASTKGFRFMGQRFIPDSYMFQELVFGRKNMTFAGTGKPFTMEIIPNSGPARAFPRGLDVMAVLGSQRALEILEEDGDTDYEFYYEQLDKLRGEFLGIEVNEWEQNLYFRWLYSLLPLLEEKEEKMFPEFMRSGAWLDKELQTALGSWAELRHDTILYAKQSYTMGVTSAPMRPVMTRGYVEPYPDVYGRIYEMIANLRDNLDDLEIEVEGVSEKMEDFEELLAGLAEISEKELDGEELDDEEYDLIWRIGDRLASLKDFPSKIMERISSEEVDDKMDIIADVHTDGNTSQVLEVGVGNPFNIYVVVEDENGLKLCRGAVFSYYEFKHPMSDRLNDEKWQEMRKTRPRQPSFVNSFTL
jgi:hypothetical protein